MGVFAEPCGFAALRDLSGVSAPIGSTSGRWSVRRCLSRAKPPSREEVCGSVGDRRDAEVGFASRSKGDGLHVLDVGVFAELLAPSRLCATCPGVGADPD
ncbi:MAG: hypothetical protein IPN01_14815 [Deltaproteobacteria bacterium]|nr:hypothetical protein [Deltaproteobacteria bacterium]